MTTLDELFGTRIAVVVPGAVNAALAGELRARLDGAGWRRYALIDRGSYDEQPGPDEPKLYEALARIAGEATGRALQFAEARALRLGPGDYLLAHHDRIHDDGPVELVLELSPASVAGAEVHYRRRGQVYFRFTPEPGALCVVERGPTVTCNHTYVSRRHAGAWSVRLVVLLRGA